MNIKLFNDNPEVLRPIIESWKDNLNGQQFNIKSDGIEKYIQELGLMGIREDADLIVLYDNDEPIGYIGLIYFESPIGSQLMAEEHYFYVVPEKRSIASMRLLRSAKYMAKQRGCSHVIFNASNLASKLHNKVCKVYERLGMKLFETSYICEV